MKTVKQGSKTEEDTSDQDKHQKRRKYQNDFNKKRYQLFGFRLLKNDPVESEMINWLSSKENMNSYIKELVKKNMEGSAEEGIKKQAK